MENKEMIAQLNFCAAQCDRCHYACHRESHKEALERCMILDQDCADICRLTSQLLERNSENAELFLKLCAEMCKRCAEECDKHTQLDHCKKCAEACRKCAEMCSEPQAAHK